VRDTHGATDVYLGGSLNLVFGIGHDGRDTAEMRGSQGSRPWRQGDGNATKDGNGDGSGSRDARDALAVVLLRTANSTSATALESFFERNCEKTLSWDARLPSIVVMVPDRLDLDIQLISRHHGMDLDRGLSMEGFTRLGQRPVQPDVQWIHAQMLSDSPLLYAHSMHILYTSYALCEGNPDKKYIHGSLLSRRFVHWRAAPLCPTSMWFW